MNSAHTIPHKITPYLVLATCSGFIIWWFRVYLTSEAVASVDLPSQIALTRQLMQQLLAGHITFYDPSGFTGWPVFQFYGFFPSLVAACGAFLLSAFSADPVTLSIHGLLVLGTALLPFSFYFAALPLARDVFASDADLPAHHKWVLAITCSVWTFWFLNHDQQWYGIGAAATMTIGLFAQLFGWHLFLIHLGLLLRYVETGVSRYSVWLSVCYGLLLISHTLTFVFSSFIVLLSWCWFSERRLGLLTTHVIGIGLVAFWFVPFVSFMGEYTTYSIIRPKGDLLELFFRYPLLGLFRSMRSWFEGEFKLLNPINIINFLLIITLFTHRKISKTGLLWTLFTFLLIALIVFSSGFVATSLPIGLHYYRILGYCFMLLVLIVSVIPLVWLRQNNRSTTILITLVALICFAVTVMLPHEKRGLIQANSANAHLKTENQVNEYFNALPEKGRVYVEFIKSHNGFAPLSQHYISSSLYQRSGFESVVNSHLQETLAYRMIVASVRMLGAKTYNTALLFVNKAQLDDRANIELLKSFGITHLVAGREQFYRRIKPFAIMEPVKIGKYRIVQIQPTPTVKVERVDKHVIGFIDLKGNLPFHLIEFYFYARYRLSGRFELVKIKDDIAIPENLSGLLINHDEQDDKLVSQWRTEYNRIIEVNFTKHYLLDHYKPHYPHNVEIDAYHEVEDYFDKVVKLPGLLTKQFGATPEINSARNSNSKLTWSDDFQTIHLDNLEPEQMYRINYSYFPYWQSSDGNIIRGSGERIFFVPHKTTATLEYRKWGFVSTIAGYLITILACSLLWVRFKVSVRRNHLSHSIKSRYSLGF